MSTSNIIRQSLISSSTVSPNETPKDENVQKDLAKEAADYEENGDHFYLLTNLHNFISMFYLQKEKSKNNEVLCELLYLSGLDPQSADSKCNSKPLKQLILEVNWSL